VLTVYHLSVGNEMSYIS